MNRICAERPRILVVEDEEPILFSLQDYLTAQGYQVDCAKDIREAEALCRATNYSAVIADLRLSGTGSMEGLEILQAVKERSPSTATILLTAYGSPAVDREARRRKVDVILSKPTPLSTLAKILSDLLKRQEPPEQ